LLVNNRRMRNELCLGLCYLC